MKNFCHFFSVALILLLIAGSCNTSSDKVNNKNADIIDSKIIVDSLQSKIPELTNWISSINDFLKKRKPMILLNGLNEKQVLAQSIAIENPNFCKNLIDSSSHKAFRTEVFNVYQARPQEVPSESNEENIYKVEMYNYALNTTTTAFVDISQKAVISVNNSIQTQPDIPTHLKNLALKIAINHPEVIKALGYKPNEAQALMANTKTALNNTKCERSMHLCVAPTFIKEGKALWVIVDLTDFRVVGIRWTNVGTTGDAKTITERKLKFDKIMECYCKEEVSLAKQDWKLDYVITTSDGLRISEVKYKEKLVINNAKVVDWHVSYSNTDGFGYSDAVGCPEFSQAAVVAETDPRVSDIVENGKIIGFALEQNFSSEQWPRPCNYNYLQRYEFYKDGRFRAAVASLGRGCGNNGTYRPVTRISFVGNGTTFSEWGIGGWRPWDLEQWKLQNVQTSYTQEGYQYKIFDNQTGGFYLEPSRGQFGDGSRGDNAYVFVTKQHLDKEEGENDLPTIGPCCNTDYRQGPEKFMLPKPESIKNTDIVVWYVPQIKNDDSKGHEYCWAESYLKNGTYQTKIYPCMSGPMFIPIKK